jgi:hypothetical protein
MRGGVVVVEEFTYADNSDSLNGIFEVDRLIFGVLGHDGWAYCWKCVNRCYYG